GSLDTSFSGDGKLTTDFTSSAGEWAFAIAIDPNGKIVVAGYAAVGSGDRFALARYNDDGSLDTSFNGTGKLTTSFIGNNAAAFAMTIDPLGRIVVAG